MIRVNNIIKRFGRKQVLKGVNIEFPKGKITSLIGSNGAGKSTLLSVISRLLPHDGGEVFIDEKNITTYKSRILAQQLSILKQFNHIGMKLTVKELVSFGRFPYSQHKLTPLDHEKVERAIRFLDLEEIADSSIDELSGGQKQRAYLAMVVAQDTEYILLDEPLNNLDMKHSVQIMKVLRKLADDLDKTVVIVMHDINFASYYSDYIIALKNGKVRHFNTTEQIINEDILKDIFDIEFSITEHNGKKLCNYFF